MISRNLRAFCIRELTSCIPELCARQGVRVPCHHGWMEAARHSPPRRPWRSSNSSSVPHLRAALCCLLSSTTPLSHRLVGRGVVTMIEAKFNFLEGFSLLLSCTRSHFPSRAPIAFLGYYSNSITLSMFLKPNCAKCPGCSRDVSTKGQQPAGGGMVLSAHGCCTHALRGSPENETNSI